MTITTQEILAVIGGAATLTSAIFWAAFLLGRLHARMERVETNVAALDTRMDKAGQKMSDLANDVQSMPNRYLLREDAVLWRGSRASDVGIK